MKEQKNKQETNRKSLWCLLFAAVVLCTAVSLLGDLAAWTVHLQGGVSFPVREAASIGIIGGADGPTAIFVTASTAPVWQTILKILLLIISILAWRHLNKRK